MRLTHFLVEKRKRSENNGKYLGCEHIHIFIYQVFKTKYKNSECLHTSAIYMGETKLIAAEWNQK